MKSKIIADVVVVVLFIALFVWWDINFPFKKEANWHEALAVVVATLSFIIVDVVLLIKVIQWIHKD